MPVVRTAEDVANLPGDRSVNGLASRGRVIVSLVGFARRDQLRWERTLNRYQIRCGCVAGGVTALASLVGGAAYLVANAESDMSLLLVGRACLVLLAALALGLVAKLAALQVTRIQFRLACERIRREIAGS